MKGDVVMIDSLSNKLVNYLDKGNYLDEDKEIYLHGAKLIISEVIGTLLLLFLGLMTNHFIEAVVYEIVLSSTRSILGGYHCKSYAACICTYAGFFLAGVIFLNYYHFTLMTILIVCLIGSINILALGPVDNMNKVASKKKKDVFKRYSKIVLIVYLTIIAALFHIHNGYLDIMVYIFIVINLLMLGGKIDYEKSKK